MGEERAIDEVPEDVLRAAREAFDSRQPLAAVADLVDDLTVDRHGLAAVRLLRFATDLGTEADLTVDVVVRLLDDAVGETCALSVAVRPPRAVLLSLRHPGPPLEVRTGPDGHGELSPVQPGLMSLLLQDLDPPGRQTQTAWVVL